MATPNKILVAVDYDPAGEQALVSALQLARSLGASVTALHVCSMPYATPPISASLPAEPSGSEAHNLFELVRSRAAEEMTAWVERHRAAAPGVALETKIVTGDPRPAVTREAERWGAELIVVGNHSRAPAVRWFLGSVAQRTVRNSVCPVLVVPAFRKAAGT